jgi:hypothetical protein
MAATVQVVFLVARDRVPMADVTHDSDEIDRAAAALGLAIAPEWKGNVAAFLDVARTMARLVEATGARADSEAAPVFTPREFKPRSAT